MKALFITEDFLHKKSTFMRGNKPKPYDASICFNAFENLFNIKKKNIKMELNMAIKLTMFKKKEKYV
jgi:hypothetical protein